MLLTLTLIPHTQTNPKTPNPKPQRRLVNYTLAETFFTTSHNKLT